MQARLNAPKPAPATEQPTSPQTLYTQKADIAKKVAATSVKSIGKGVMSFLSDTKNIAAQTWERLKADNADNLANNKGLQTPMAGPQAGLRMLGDVAQGVNEIAGAAFERTGITPAIKAELGNMGKALNLITPDAISEPVKEGFNYLVNGAIDKYSAWKQANPDQARNLESIGQIAMAIPNIEGGAALVKASKEAGVAVMDVAGSASKTALKATTGALKTTTGALKDTGTALGDAAGSIKQKAISATADIGKPIEENVKNALTNPERSADISSKLSDYFDQASTAKGKTGAVTPIETASEDNFKKALGTIQEKLKAAGEMKQQSLVENGSKTVDVQKAYDNFGKNLDERLGTNFDPKGELVSATGRESLIAGSASDNRLISMVRDSIDTLKRNPTLQRVNDVVDKLQSELYKTKQIGAVAINGKTEAVVKQFMKDLDLAAKDVGGDAYKLANADYARLIKLKQLSSKALGENFSKAGSIAKQVFSPAGLKMKQLVTALEAETGLPIFEDLTLAKFAMDSVKDPRIKSLLDQLQNIPTSKGAILQKILDYIPEKLSTPEAMKAKAQRLIDSTPSK
jgi:hypothetical protein